MRRGSFPSRSLLFLAKPYTNGKLLAPARNAPLAPLLLSIALIEADKVWDSCSALMRGEIPLLVPLRGTNKVTYSQPYSPKLLESSSLGKRCFLNGCLITQKTAPLSYPEGWCSELCFMNACLSPELKSRPVGDWLFRQSHFPNYISIKTLLGLYELFFSIPRSRPGKWYGKNWGVLHSRNLDLHNIACITASADLQNSAQARKLEGLLNGQVGRQQYNLRQQERKIKG